MKLPYQIIAVVLIIGSLMLVISFTNCQGMRQGSDEFGTTTFYDYGPNCTQGVICESKEQISCYDPDHFYQVEPGWVCQKEVQGAGT